MTIKLPGDRGYAALTEGGLANYSGMGLVATGSRTFEMRLGHAQPLNYPFKLRYGEEEGVRLAKAAAVSGTISTPWRVIMLGRDLNTLVNSDIVNNVSAPADPALFPKGIETDWVKPGRAVWKYLDGGENTFEGMQEFTRLAKQLGFEYNVLEGFWQKWPESQLRRLAEESKAQGVGVFLWKHSKDLRTPEARKEFFDLCARNGIAGAKIDFFDHEAKEVVDVYAALLREAAAHKVLIDFHGANKPTGEARTWPNELTREAVYGFERGKNPAWSRHNTTLPFTRYLAGPGDFTPTIFGDRRRETSWAHQIASAAIFTSPLLVYGGHPKSLLDNPAVEIIKSIAATWDETRVLPFSEIGEVAGFARRSGDTWIVAIMNGPTARTVSIDLGFLGTGSRSALLAKDPAATANAQIEMSSTQVQPGTVLKVELRGGGGFVGRFTR
jgi:alpha-glucosidase